VDNFFTKSKEEQAQSVTEIEAVVLDSSASALAQKMAKFLSVTLKRSQVDGVYSAEAVEKEQERISNMLLLNIENISEEKVNEFYMRLEVLEALAQ
tara:strand:+ start:855 stop:1142 length:288 start_codon:yes stop_codon:yes gene_type:complete